MIKNVANAFSFIQRLYDETATLIREIERLLGSEPERFMIGRPSGYSISTKGSNSLEQQNVNLWLTRRFAVFFVPESAFTSKGGQTITPLPTANLMYLRFLLDGYNSFNFGENPIGAPSLLYGVLHDAARPSGKTNSFEKRMTAFEYMEAKLLSDLPNVELGGATGSVTGALQIVPLLTLTDSEAVNDHVIQPLLQQWRRVVD